MHRLPLLCLVLGAVGVLQRPARADVTLTIEADNAMPGETAWFRVFAVTDSDDVLSGFNLPLEIGGDGVGLPSGFGLHVEPMQNVFFGNYSFNVQQNDIWGIDGIANADGNDLPLSSDADAPTKLFDLAIDVAQTVDPGAELTVEIFDMLLLNIAPASLAKPIDAFALISVGGTEPLSEDCNRDGVVDSGDLDCACAAQSIATTLAMLGLLAGDLDANGEVGFADFLKLSGNFGRTANYAGGDINCSGEVGFSDFLTMSSNFGKHIGQTATVPEPSSQFLTFGMLLAGVVLRGGVRVLGNI